MLPEKRIGFEIRSLNNLIKRDVERSNVFQESTGLHGWAIRWLNENRDRDIYQRDFEESFSIRRSTASNILALMEKNGLITRENVQQDKRLKKIVLTQKAVRLHEKIEQDINLREEMLMKGISKEDLEVFFRVAEKVKRNLEEKI